MKILIINELEYFSLKLPVQMKIISIITKLREMYPNTFENKRFSLCSEKNGKTLEKSLSISDCILSDNPPKMNLNNETIFHIKFKKDKNCSVM